MNSGSYSANSQHQQQNDRFPKTFRSEDLHRWKRLHWAQLRNIIIRYTDKMNEHCKANILTSAPYYWDRRVQEAIHIQQSGPLMNLDCGLYLNTAWRSFVPTLTHLPPPSFERSDSIISHVLQSFPIFSILLILFIPELRPVEPFPTDEDPRIETFLGPIILLLMR